MSINIEELKDNQENSPFGGSGDKGEKYSVYDLNTQFSRGLPLDVMNKHVEEFKDHFNKFLDRYSPPARGIKVNLHVLDKSIYHTPASALLLSLEIAPNGTRKNTYVAMYGFILESTCSTLTNRRIPIHGYSNDTQIVTVVSDVWNKSFIDTAKAIVHKTVPDVPERDSVVAVGHTVIRSDIDHSEARLYSILAQAVNAIESVAFAEVGGVQGGFSLKSIQQSEFLTSLDFNPERVVRPAGTHVRSDISISLKGGKTSSKDGIQQIFNSHIDLLNTEAYVDLVPVPPKMVNGIQSTQLFHPRLIVSDIISRTNFMTLEFFLLGVSNILAVGKNVQWRGAFAPRISDGTDFRDIGAMTYLIDGKKVNTKVDKFTNAEWKDMLNTFINPQPIYSILTEEGTELSWVHQYFTAAADGNTHANTALVRALDKLTDGAFSKRFKAIDPSGEVMIRDSFLVYTGYYLDDKGTKRSLQEIDALAILNTTGNKGIQTYLDWVASIYDTNVPEAIRMENQYKLITGLFNSTITGRGRLVSFKKTAITALDAAMVDAGLAPKVNSSFVYDDNTGNHYFGGYNDYVVENYSEGLYGSRAPMGDTGSGYSFSPYNRFGG